MTEDRLPDEAPADEDEDLIDESDETLEPDRSPKAALEGGLTEGEVEPASDEEVEFEDEDEDEEGA